MHDASGSPVDVPLRRRWVRGRHHRTALLGLMLGPVLVAVAASIVDGLSEEPGTTDVQTQ